jgi:hypothetical protein
MVASSFSRLQGRLEADYDDNQLGLANLVYSRYLQLWAFMLLRVGAFIISQWS